MRPTIRLKQALGHYSRTGKKLSRAYDASSRRSRGDLKTTMQAARYSLLQARMQASTYKRALQFAGIQNQDVVADYGSNTGSLGLTALDQGLHIEYIALDGSQDALEQVASHQTDHFKTETKLTTELTELENLNADHIFALGSITHWDLDTTNPEEDIVELMAYMADQANKSAVISLYPQTPGPILFMGAASLMMSSTIYDLFSAFPISELIDSKDKFAAFAVTLSFSALAYTQKVSLQYLMQKSTWGRKLISKIPFLKKKLNQKPENMIWPARIKAIQSELEKRGYTVEVDQPSPSILGFSGPYHLFKVTKP